MNHLRKLSLSIGLTLVFSMLAFAGETSTPPCDPGETHGPPCSTSMASGDTEDSLIDADIADSITETARVVFESVLPLI